MQERLQKILSARGIASRRKAEEYIERGLVTVNGKTAQLGDKADPEKDMIEVDGKVLEERAEMLYFLMHKPRGVETSNVARYSFDRFSLRKRTTKNEQPKTNHRSTTVRELLPDNLQGKIYPVGRLDKDSEGLLLFTNDGPLAYRLTHPTFEHEKEYEVEVEGAVTEGMLEKMRRGMTILGEKTKAASVTKLDASHFRIALTEGKNRQIRRMVQKVGASVKTLRRIRIMSLEDRRLKPGEIRPLSKEEQERLLKEVGLEGRGE